LAAFQTTSGKIFTVHVQKWLFVSFHSNFWHHHSIWRS